MHVFYFVTGPARRSLKLAANEDGVTDPNIPTNVGTNVEDLVLVYDTNQALLYEDGDGRPTFLRFEQTAGQALTITCVAYGYIAGSWGRYPAASGKIGGLDTLATNGLVAPTF